jgi:oxaloacetate decarboxylase (Na+ extruding) subunit gamma
MQAFNEALLLMFVGMITVFFILFLIVMIGDVIIRLSNRYLPDELVENKPTKPNATSANTYAAINAAIEIATKGKGKVTNIQKL